MQLYRSKLPKSPESIDLRKLSLGVEYLFGKDAASSHVGIQSGTPAISASETAHWSLYRSRGYEIMEGNPGYFKISLPYPECIDVNARLHIAVTYIDFETIDLDGGDKHRQDFDRLMDIAKLVITDMLDAGLICSGEKPIDIVAEPLSVDGTLRLSQVPRVSVDIGASWLYDHDFKPIFSGYRRWNPGRERWISDGK